MNSDEPKERCATWVEVDLSVIAENVRRIRARVGVQVMAVVKANGYGHGAVPVARAALEGGATWLAVARSEEAFELRRAGLDCPILLLGLLPPARIGEAIGQRISLTVWDADQLPPLSAAAQRAGEAARLHLKVDTGMSRLGVQPPEVPALARRLAATPGLLFEGLFTHFARADEPQVETTADQERLFYKVLAALESEDLRPPLVHAANSAAALTRPSAYNDMVRLGIAMYGLHPSAQVPCPEGVRPALAWKAVLAQVKTLPAGRGVSYGHIYVTSRAERIGSVPLGYADGFRRVNGNQVLVSGRRVPVVGHVCMDQFMLQLDSVPEAKAGDEVVIIGEQGEERIAAEEVAARWGTINYEVVCGIGARVPRLYG
ncbi:MAG: alanine racemase [Anaerolineales bacterium]|nr:alanine racemase [Anaerolineales bacterium]